MEPGLLNAFGGVVLGASDAVVRAVTEATDLDSVTTTALLAVHTRPDQSVGALAELLGTTHSGAVRTVNRLQASGLVTRRPGPDGRTAALRVTSLGKKLSVGALDAREAALSELLASLDPAQVDALSVLVHDLAPRVAKSRSEAQRVCRLCEHAVCRGDNCPVGGHI